jgi:hypothetical protein
MKHYIKSYLWKNSITFDEQWQDGIQTLIVRPKHKEQLIEFLKDEKAFKKCEEKINLVFITLK